MFPFPPRGPWFPCLGKATVADQRFLPPLQERADATPPHPTHDRETLRRWTPKTIAAKRDTRRNHCDKPKHREFLLISASRAEHPEISRAGRLGRVASWQ